MKKWRVASVGPTELYIHPSVLVYALYSLALRHGLFFLVAILSIMLHEAAHACAAAVFGSPPSALEITPLGAVMRLHDERHMRAWQRVLMLLSGPLATLGLCSLAWWRASEHLLSAEVRWIMFASNLTILLMNMLPVLPLDGGRLLTLALEHILPKHTTDRMMRLCGNIVGVGLIALNLWCTMARGGWNLSLAFSGCCILYSAHKCTLSQAMEELRTFMDRKIMLENKRMVRTLTLTVLSNVTVREIVRNLPSRRLIEVCCLQPGSQREVGRFTEPELIELYLRMPGAQIGSCVKEHDVQGVKISTI